MIFENTSQKFLNMPHWGYKPVFKGLTGIYFNASFRVLAIGMSGLFIPLFLLELTKDLSIVFLFYLVTQLIQLALIFPLNKLVSKIGPDWSMALGTIAEIIFLICLFFSSYYPTFIWLASFFAALVVPLYWFPYHLAFTSECDHKNLGKQIGIISSINRIVGAFAPFIGGLIITGWGYSPLWLFAVAIMLLSIIPLFVDQYDKKEKPAKLKNVINGLKGEKFRPFTISFVGVGIEAVIYGILWPIFVFLSLKRLDLLGAISCITLLTSLLLVFWIGKKSGKNSKKLINFGVKISSLNWLIKAFFTSALWLTIFDVVYKMASVFVWIPFDVLVYKKAKDNPVEVIMIREISIRIGILVGIILSWLVYEFLQSWTLTFAIGSLSMILIGKISKISSD